MKKVVVTGAKGGTGRSIVKVFREAGYAVHWAIQVLVEAAQQVDGPLRPQGRET